MFFLIILTVFYISICSVESNSWIDYDSISTLSENHSLNGRQLQAVTAYTSVGCYGDKAIRALPILLGTGMTSVVQCYNLAVAAKYSYFALEAGKDCYGSNILTDATRYGQCPLSTGSIAACACNRKCNTVGPDICGGSWSFNLYTISPPISPILPSAAPILPSAAPILPSAVPILASVSPILPSAAPISAAPILPSAAPILPTFAPITLTANPTTTTTQGATTTIYTRLGCYGDKATRALATKMPTIVTSIADCYNFARANKFKYFGLEAGNSCYASNLLAAAQRYGSCPLLPTDPLSTGSAPACTCTKKCTNGIDVCGGSWAFDLFVIDYVTFAPSGKPSAAPILPSAAPILPSAAPIIPSAAPILPSAAPILPSAAPIFPSAAPILPSAAPILPSAAPILPSAAPILPSAAPILPSAVPTNVPVLVPSFTPTFAPTVSPYNLLGCYGDRATRAFALKIGTGMTSIRQCYTLAAAGNYAFFGLEAGTDCYVSNAAASVTRYGSCPVLPTDPLSTGSAPSCTCLKKCSNLIDNCGGAWALNVYAIPPKPSTSPTIAPVTTVLASPTIAPVTTVLASPTIAPVTTVLASPTIAPVTTVLASPTIAPVTTVLASPTIAPVTTVLASPTIAPVTTVLASPTIAPVTTVLASPTIAPVTTVLASPTIAPVTTVLASPTIAPVTTVLASPTIAPVTTVLASPTIAPVISTGVINNFKAGTHVAYFGDEAGWFYAIDATTGIQYWRTFLGYTHVTFCSDLPGANFSISGTAVFDRPINTIYVVGGAGAFNALSMVTGAVLWKIPTFYDPQHVHNYGGLLLYNKIVYVTMGAMCDLNGVYLGGIYSVDTVTKTVSTYFAPYQGGPAGSFGGGIWGLGGLTLGDMKTPSTSYIYTPVGNCQRTGNEASHFCERILQVSLDLTTVASNVQAPAGIKTDNDMGSSATYFNGFNEPQSSGCKVPIVTGYRKDGMFIVARGDNLQPIQFIQTGSINQAGAIEQAAWDPFTNMLIVPQGNSAIATATEPAYISALQGYKLTAACTLTLVWTSPMSAMSSPTIVGPAGQRVALVTTGFGLKLVDVLTGTQPAGKNLLGSARNAPVAINGMLYMGTQGNSVTQRGLEAWK